MNVVVQLGIVGDGHHVAVLRIHRGIDEVDHLLGLSGALQAHDYLDHFRSLLT